MSSDEDIKSTLRAVFVRKGGSSSRTRLWEEWDPVSRTVAESTLRLVENEAPVLLAMNALGQPVVLTTRRVMGEFGVLPVTEIAAVRPMDFAEKRKDELSELEISLSSGKSIKFALEAGPSYFAFWSVLLHISKRNTRGSLAS
jgi:hypothetical protein